MTTINLNTVRLTIENRVETELINSPPVTVIFNNMPFKPDIDKNFVQCLIDFGQTEYSAFNTNTVNGTIIFNIFTKSGVGSGSNLIIGKRIRDLFNKVTVSDVIFNAPNGPTLLQSTAPEGYFQSIISVDFEIYETI